MKRLAILGSALSGGAAQIIDACLSTNSHTPVAIYDSNPAALGNSMLGVPVAGSSDDIEIAWRENKFDEIIIAIGGDLQERKALYETILSIGIPFANIIDKTAQIRTGVDIGSGNVILANVFIGPGVTVGNNCYLITNTSINHDTCIGSHVYFGPGCTVAGHVNIGYCVRFDLSSGAKAHLTVKDGSYIAPNVILTESI
jgi:acetyltransferase-like isoleucine patch superfamily enzyme